MPESLTLETVRGDRILISPEDAILFAFVGWTVNPNGYAYGSYLGKKCYLHRLIAQHMGFPMALQVDHIDRNKLNNCRHNLRPATPSQNRQNSRKRLDTSSALKGVTRRETPHGTLWEANCDGYLGLFGTENEAGRAYDLEAMRLFGEFAWLNFPGTYG